MRNILDFIFPKKQAATVPVGGFEGAQNFSTDRSIIQNYAPASEAFGDAPTYAREELLRLTRYLVNNYSVVERILTVCQNYAVGAGIFAQAATTDQIYNDAATKYFDRWSTSYFCSANNELNLFDIQKLIIRELLIAGEIFIVMVKSDSGYPQLIPVSSEQVRSTGKKNDKSKDGLFFDERGKVTAYQIFFQDKKPEIVEASNVIHLRINKNVNQRRGVSCFAASLNPLRDHRDVVNLLKKSVKVHSALAATVTKKAGEAGNDGLFQHGGVNKTTVKPAGGKAQVSQALNAAFGGAVAYLNEGENVQLLTSDRPSDNVMTFLEFLMRDVCMNLSLSYEFIVDPTKLSSAATRFIISDADVFFKNLQNIVIDGFLNRLYSWVIASAVNDGKIPKSSDSDWFSVSWVRPISITIDRSRMDSSELSFIENNLVSYDTFFSSRSLNWKTELEQMAQEKKYIAELEAKYGVTLGKGDKKI